MKAIPFQMPSPVTILGRSSSLTNAFVNGIIPILEPNEKEILRALEILELDPEDLKCAYCGDTATEWDHLHPLIKDKRPTGFISEINNLVPACGKCNQSKGNKPWRDWMFSTAKLSPLTRNKLDLERKKSRIEEYERFSKPEALDLECLAGRDLWNEHWKNHEELMNTLQRIQLTSDKIRINIKEQMNSKQSNKIKSEISI